MDNNKKLLIASCLTAIMLFAAWVVVDEESLKNVLRFFRDFVTISASRVWIVHGIIMGIYFLAEREHWHVFNSSYKSQGLYQQKITIFFSVLYYSGLGLMVIYPMGMVFSEPNILLKSIAGMYLIFLVICSVVTQARRFYIESPLYTQDAYERSPDNSGGGPIVIITILGACAVGDGIRTILATYLG